MTLLRDVRAGLRGRLATIAGLNVGKAEDSGAWPDDVNPPAAMIKWTGGEFEQAAGQLGDQLTVAQVEIHLALTLKGGLVNAQHLTEEYLSNTGDKSIYAAIVGDRSLGGAVKYSFVRGWRSFDSVEINGREFMGAIVDVEVWLS